MKIRVRIGKFSGNVFSFISKILYFIELKGIVKSKACVKGIVESTTPGEVKFSIFKEKFRIPRYSSNKTEKNPVNYPNISPRLVFIIRFPRIKLLHI